MPNALIRSLAVLLGLTSCIQKAQQITLSELPATLDKLAQHEFEYDFFGITSNGVDCLYFTEHNGSFDIEFEAMISQQLPYLDTLKIFAHQHGYSTTDTTYGNKPEYNSKPSAPVLRINTHANKVDVAKFGESILKQVFRCNESTRFEVVP